MLRQQPDCEGLGLGYLRCFVDTKKFKGKMKMDASIVGAGDCSLADRSRTLEAAADRTFVTLSL